MIVVSPNVALVVFIVIIVIALLVAWHLGDYQSYDTNWIHTFIAVLAGLGVFVVFMFYYALVTLQMQEQDLASTQEMSRINNGLIKSYFKELKASSSIIPEFISSLHPLIPTIYRRKSDENTPQAYIAKISLSNKIFAIWEDVVLSYKNINNDHLSYITDFIQKTNSKSLYDLWVVSKINYNIDTQTYGDLLFEYGMSVKEHTPEAYVIRANTLLENIRYKQLMKLL